MGGLLGNVGEAVCTGGGVGDPEFPASGGAGPLEATGAGTDSAGGELGGGGEFADEGGVIDGGEDD